eukprot:4457363-Amphidinium_carterae.1
MDMCELHLKIKDLNPKAEFVGIKTDCLVYNKIKIHPPLSEEWGGVKKCDVPDIKDCVLNQNRRIGTNIYELTNADGSVVEVDDVIRNIDNGLMTNGMADT